MNKSALQINIRILSVTRLEQMGIIYFAEGVGTRRRTTGWAASVKLCETPCPPQHFVLGEKADICASLTSFCFIHSRCVLTKPEKAIRAFIVKLPSDTCSSASHE